MYYSPISIKFILRHYTFLKLFLKKTVLQGLLEYSFYVCCSNNRNVLHNLLHTMAHETFASLQVAGIQWFILLGSEA